MGYKCSVAKCKSGYASANSPTTKKISFFAFPKNNDLRNAWTRACHRQGFEPTEHSRICSLHFEESDFEVFSSDTVLSRRLYLFAVKFVDFSINFVRGQRCNEWLLRIFQSISSACRALATLSQTYSEFFNQFRPPVERCQRVVIPHNQFRYFSFNFVSTNLL